MKLEFTTTATIRPLVLAQTLRSFRANLQGVEWGQSTLYFNIDPLPSNKNKNELVEVAHTFFPKIRTNCPASPSFPAAVKWCWSQPQDRYFFHLEDDWKLIHPVHIGELFVEMQKVPGRSCVNLRAYLGIQDDRICLSPGLFRTEHAKIMAERMTVDANPEKQLRAKDASNPSGDRHLGFFGGQFPPEVVIVDVGRQWLEKSGYRKEVTEGVDVNEMQCLSNVHFTKWEKET